MIGLRCDLRWGSSEGWYSGGGWSEKCDLEGGRSERLV